VVIRPRTRWTRGPGDRYFTEWHAELHPFTDQRLCFCPACAMREGMWPGSGRRFWTICPDDPTDDPGYEPDPAGMQSGQAG
jgi:hypothetical protein